MWAKIKERVANLFDLVTSKKMIVACGAIAVLLILVTSVAKIIAVGAVAVAYILVQGWVDVQKARLPKVPLNKAQKARLAAKK